MPLILPLSLMLVFGLASCSDDNSRISAQITAQFKASTSAAIDLSLVGPASWERVCALFPYSNNQDAEKVLGFKWDANAKTAISHDDSMTVLAFIQDQQVVAYTEHPRRNGDFSELKPQCYPCSQAIINRELLAH